MCWTRTGILELPVYPGDVADVPLRLALRSLTTGSVYQEYLARSLTEKYNNLETEMDKIIHDANSEIDKLNQKISSRSKHWDWKSISWLTLFTDLQIDRDKLQSENTSLVNAFREKSRKHQQTQELYDRLKRKEMMNVTQSAAFGAVEEVLSNNVAGRPGQSRPTPNSFSTRPQEQHDVPMYQYGPGQDLGHQRAGSNGSGGSGGVMMPPPQRRPMVFGGHMLGPGSRFSASANVKRLTL